MPVPAQTPQLVNKEWRVYISDNAFQSFLHVYYRNFESWNRNVRQYSVLWFRQVMKTINFLAGQVHQQGVSNIQIDNFYSPKKKPYGKIVFETKQVYFSRLGEYYNLLIITGFSFNLPYNDVYGVKEYNYKSL